jgi:hypothetical protein
VVSFSLPKKGTFHPWQRSGGSIKHSRSAQYMPLLYRWLETELPMVAWGVGAADLGLMNDF